MSDIFKVFQNTEPPTIIGGENPDPLWGSPCQFSGRADHNGGWLENDEYEFALLDRVDIYTGGEIVATGTVREIIHVANQVGRDCIVEFWINGERRFERFHEDDLSDAGLEP